MTFCIKKEQAFHVREEKEYPWPCVSDPKRVLRLYPSDVLTIQSNGKCFKHTGIAMTDIEVPKEDLISFERDCWLQMI